MGKRGPAPKPTALKVLQGTYRPDRAAHNEPAPDPTAPNCPTWLHGEAKREWRRVVPELEPLGLATGIDRAVLAAYCQAYAEWWEMERDIAENGRVQVVGNGYEQVRPSVSIRDRARDAVHKLSRELGLTPSARSRISVPEQKKETANPFHQIGTS